MTAPTARAARQALEAQGLEGAALELAVALGAPARHAARVALAVEALRLEAGRVLARPGPATSQAAVAAVGAWLAEVSQAPPWSQRPGALAGLGTGRRHAGDGAAWDAALVAAAHEMARAAGVARSWTQPAGLGSSMPDELTVLWTTLGPDPLRIGTDPEQVGLDYSTDPSSLAPGVPVAAWAADWGPSLACWAIDLARREARDGPAGSDLPARWARESVWAAGAAIGALAPGASDDALLQFLAELRPRAVYRHLTLADARQWAGPETTTDAARAAARAAALADAIR